MRAHRLIAMAVAATLPVLCGPVERNDAAADGPTYRVPYRMSETLHLIVRAKFNGKGPFNFIVDTGAPAMFVTTDVAKKVGVEANDDGWATFEKMEIEGGATIPNAQARVEDIFQIRGMNALSLPGVRLDGVLGYTVLARYRMELDLSKSHMRWTQLDFEPPQPRPLLGDDNGRARSAPPELEAIADLIENFAPLFGGQAGDGAKKGKGKRGLGGLFGGGPADAPAVRGFLGITLSDADGAVHVDSALPQSPADAAGLRPGDVIVEFAGQLVRSAPDVLKAASAVGPDEEVLLRVKRGNEHREIAAKAGKGL